jgi:hypothetical protein
MDFVQDFTDTSLISVVTGCAPAGWVATGRGIFIRQLRPAGAGKAAIEPPRETGCLGPSGEVWWLQSKAGPVADRLCAVLHKSCRGLGHLNRSGWPADRHQLPEAEAH